MQDDDEPGYVTFTVGQDRPERASEVARALEAAGAEVKRTEEGRRTTLRATRAGEKVTLQLDAAAVIIVQGRESSLKRDATIASEATGWRVAVQS